MSVAAVVVAAGQGTRFGGAKQFARFLNESVAARSVRFARSVAETVVLVVPLDYDGDGEGADVVVTGGATRAASVRAGLALVGEVDFVIVHDAARPLASSALFESVLDAVRDGADGAIPGIALSDTVKRITRDDSVRVVSVTIDRDDLVAVQTPQAFRRDILVRAHAHDDDASDDAGLVEAIGGRVVVVEGEATNLKITHQGDLRVLATLEQDVS
jgi:2-C-methyl-D-erythritol 4-phosphate cytidylyltransferase